MNLLCRWYWTAKGVGWENLPRRVWQVWRVRTGRLRRRLAPSRFGDALFRKDCPAAPDRQPELWRARAGRFPPRPSSDALRQLADDATWEPHVLEPCRKLLAGEYRFFGHWYASLGWPPDFGLDPVHGVRWASGGHWLDGADSLGGLADIKFVWEPSRFSLAYLLARAYVRDGQERWAEGFWRMFDAWMEQNPPEQSAAWRCGQEMTFRLMALLFAAVATLASPQATAERLHALSRLAWQTGRHVESNINAALAQKNNHGISEAVGLWTVGVLFPEFAPAERWRRRGTRLLAAEVRRQVYDDGSYVQHSLNYHRVMLDDLLWAFAVSRSARQELPDVLHDRLARATEWLGQMIDPGSGMAPNYGANDGAQVLPLSCCDYLDYRPVLQAGGRALLGRGQLSPGPWDEKALWLFGGTFGSPTDDRAHAPAVPLDLGPRTSDPRAASWSAPDGGYYVLRGRRSWCMVRCHTYRDRPSQVDMLHLDLWMAGLNVLRDAGTYMYNCPEPWRGYFLSTAAHNTAAIDGHSQMVKGPRFLWFRWTRARLLRFETSPDGRVGYFQGEHYGYRRLGVVHRRAVCRIDDGYVVVDDLLGRGEHRIALRWRLAPGDWRQNGTTWTADLAGQACSVSIAAPATLRTELLCGQEPPLPEGWESLYYGRREEVPVLVVSGAIDLPVRCVTVAGPTAGLPQAAETGSPSAESSVVLHGIAGAVALAETSCGRIRIA